MSPLTSFTSITRIWDWLNNETPIFCQALPKVLILEVIGVVGVYTLYYKMNSSEDFRHKMKRRWPSVLEVYYKSNEWAGIYGLKELDEEKWLTKKP